MSIDELKKSLLLESATSLQAVKQVRDAFVSGIPPIQTVGSGSRDISYSSSNFGVFTSNQNSISLPQTPELDSVEIISNNKIGTLDSFFTKITVSLKKDLIKNIKFVKIMKSYNGRSKNTVKPAFSVLSDGAVKGTFGSVDPVGMQTIRTGELGISNKLTDFVSDNLLTKQRNVIASSSLRVLPPQQNTNRINAGQASLVSIKNIDPSVSTNVKFSSNLLATSKTAETELPLTVGKKSGLNILGGNSVSVSTSVITETGNSANFYEACSIPVSRCKTVGDFVEITFIDSATVYGASYSYYAVSVDADGIIGKRSRIISADVLSISSVDVPNVIYSLIAHKPRFSIMCSGKFIDHVEIFRKGGNDVIDRQLLGSPDVLIKKSTEQFVNSSGFYHIADKGVLNGACTFTDGNVTPGQTVEYRIYAVDSFGMKSQTPFSCKISIPDIGKKYHIQIPSITAEQYTGEKNVKVSVSCADENVVAFIVERAEIGNISGYSIPSQPNHFVFGVVGKTNSKSRNSPVFPTESKKSWSGILYPVDGLAYFNDFAVRYDTVYKYSVKAVDKKGNTSQELFSKQVKVQLKKIAEPVSVLSATVVHTESGMPKSISIQWLQNANNISPADLVGSQNVLLDTAVRNIFQVERKAVGALEWQPFPPTSSTFVVDEVLFGTAPSYRPEFPKVSNSYEYRVITMQSGGFLSVYSDTIKVDVSHKLFSVENLVVKTTNSAIKPINAVVSWNYEGSAVDRWIIEKASVNKVFGSKILSADSPQVKNLKFIKVAEVTREASRASSVTSQQTFDKKIFAGNRFYIDKHVDMMNCFFYRVKAVDFVNNESEWSYCGVSMVDSPHDRKFFSALSDTEKKSLSNDERKIVKKI